MFGGKNQPLHVHDAFHVINRISRTLYHWKS